MNCVASTFCYFVANTEHRLVIHTLVRDRSGLWNRHFNKSPFMYNIMYYLLVVAQKYDVFLRFNQVIIFVIAVLYCVVNYRFLNQTLFRLLLNRPARPQHTRQQGQVFQTAVCVCCTLLHVDDDDGYEQLLHWIDLSRNERGSDQQLFVL